MPKYMDLYCITWDKSAGRAQAARARRRPAPGSCLAEVRSAVVNCVGAQRWEYLIAPALTPAAAAAACSGAQPTWGWDGG